MTKPDETSAARSTIDPTIDPKGFELHARLVAGDRMAAQQIWDYYNDLVRAGLRKLMKPSPHNDDIASEYAQRAIVRLIERPNRFDPSRNKSLFGYLRMDVEGDVLNFLGSSRYRTRIDSIDRSISSANDDVGERTIGGNIAADDPMPDEIIVIREGDETVARIRQRVVETPDEGIVFDLQYVHAERATEIFAEALGMTHLTVRQQVSDIQKIKDRLAKRLRRMREDEL